MLAGRWLRNVQQLQAMHRASQALARPVPAMAAGFGVLRTASAREDNFMPYHALNSPMFRAIQLGSGSTWCSFTAWLASADNSQYGMDRSAAIRARKLRLLTGRSVQETMTLAELNAATRDISILGVKASSDCSPMKCSALTPLVVSRAWKSGKGAAAGSRSHRTEFRRRWLATAACISPSYETETNCGSASRTPSAHAILLTTPPQRIVTAGRLSPTSPSCRMSSATVPTNIGPSFRFSYIESEPVP